MFRAVVHLKTIVQQNRIIIIIIKNECHSNIIVDRLQGMYIMYTPMRYFSIIIMNSKCLKQPNVNRPMFMFLRCTSFNLQVHVKLSKTKTKLKLKFTVVLCKRIVAGCIAAHQIAKKIDLTFQIQKHII